jgi:hypothetical protein
MDFMVSLYVHDGPFARISADSRQYNRDGGSSILALTMEVDADGQLPALAVSGSFVFRLD